MSEAHHPPDEGATRRVRAALMQKVNGDEEMFALGGSIARVIELADADEKGPHDLAYFVLSDVALTQRILRLSNTVRYRTVSGTAVTTVSRAIALLGFDNVKTTALAMLLVDTLDNGAHAGSVRIELEASLCASLVGREMAKLSFYQGAEEAAIGALFKNLGALLVASHEHARYREINQLSSGARHTPAQASQMILGCSYDTLCAAVLSEWKIPEVIVRAQAALPAGALKTAANRAEWMRQVASFSLEVARLLAKSTDPAATPEARALLARYGAAFEMDAAGLERLFANVGEGMQGLMESMNLQPLAKVEMEHGEGLPEVLMLATLDAGEEEEGAWPSGKPKNARELLLAGVQDVTQLRAGANTRVNDVILAVLETLYQALGFRFATVCLKDARAGQYRARVSFGAQQARVQAGFLFPLPPPGARDLFALAMENDADLMISDAASPKIRDLLPPWHRALLPDAKSFIVLPLVVGKAQLGFFYADRAVTAPEGVPPDETAMIRALKRQVLAALAAE
ncbi:MULTISPECIES: HDOD domain-containing protein [unclassified Massilia]|uniref:HDOD domain-containing protein n=1 Tax=unclassified Massilia TaxID=2609279 RepID=UPI00178095C1|nr:MULTISPECIES: HDOD domain-containing protein [unclassified Massilia]MBD8532440.1 HDOD domain-containing protein [Massilia sp. CFBP 13647]MBD8675734.1 HDOD domain-containing protein [Massilia sp. CFBP 13721]